jgi:hypothetical protein
MLATGPTFEITDADPEEARVSALHLAEKAIEEFFAANLDEVRRVLTIARDRENATGRWRPIIHGSTSLALSGSGGWRVAMQGASAVGTSRCGCAVRVENQCPAPAVHGDEVMEAAEQTAVGDRRFAAVGARPQVVNVTDHRGLVTARKPTVMIPASDGAADVHGDGVGGGADVERQADSGGRADELAPELGCEPAGAGQQPHRLGDRQPGSRAPGSAEGLVAVRVGGEVTMACHGEVRCVSTVGVVTAGASGAGAAVVVR